MRNPAKQSLLWALALGLAVLSANASVACKADPPKDEPAADEPAADEPATDEPATEEPATEEPADPRETPTHEQAAIITVPDGDQKLAIHTFCLDCDGRLLASCGGQRFLHVRSDSGYELKEVTDPSCIKVLSPEGELLATWDLDITPQAMNVGPDGSIYAGGQGRIVKLDKNGKVLLTADAPNLSELPPLPEIPEPEPEPDEDDAEAIAAKEEKEAAVQELKQQQQASMKDLQEAFTKLREVNKSEDEPAKAQAAARYESAVKQYQQLRQRLEELTVDARTLAIRARSAALRKRAMNGLAVTDQDVFMACPAIKGYGYDVWRTDLEFGAAKRIVTGLRGCCGQLDIQAHDGKVYVAENSRKRVVCYDREGEQLSTWGSSSREGVEGFGSCCNPMNLRLGPDGSTYTSEASVGRIKRYSPTGECLGVVGTATIVPGCKHVAIGISADGKRIYMLDITRSHIVVMTEKPAEG